MKDNYSVYIHIPFCKARCGYCVFSSCIDLSLADKYADALCREMEFYSDKSLPIYTVYLGGGTPSCLPAAILNKIFSALNKYFDMSQVCEMTVECNPESTTPQLLECLAENGVNRLSFGLQSVNDATLKRIGRLHTYGGFVAAYDLARKYGFNNINADVIIGLPESESDFVRTVQTVADMDLSHVSAYALELHPETPLYKTFPQNARYSDDALADMYDKAVQILSDNGFARYEISNFARGGSVCKHNLNYWREGRYFAFGAAASGFVGDVRFTHPFGLTDYLRTDASQMHCECETLSARQQAEEYVMLGMRLADGIDVEYLSRRYGCDFFNAFSNADKLIKQGFLQCESGRVFVPSDKFYVVNSILCELLN